MKKKIKIMTKYYSFFVGDENTPREKWMLYDIKIPAPGPREAIYMDQWLKSGCKHPFHLNYLTVRIWYREIIEFERVRSSGLTRITFKETNKIPVLKLKL